MKSPLPLLLTAAAAAALLPAAARAQFVPGNLAVERIGDGTQTFSNTGNSIFIDQYALTGSLVNTVAIPSTGASALIVSGTATSEGALSLSQDRTQLVIAGYNVAVGGSANLSSATGTAVPRGVGTVSSTGVYTFGAQTSSFSANNIRTGTLSTAGGFYLGGGNTGTVLAAGGGGAGTVVQTTITNSRVNNIVNGMLYLSSGAGTRGIYTLGGLPTTTGNTATLVLATGANSSPYDFVLNPTGTILYVADDSSIANGGGIQRYDFNGTTFALTYTLGTGTGATVGARGLAVDFTGTNPLVYATTSEASANRLISILDTGSTSTATTLATAPTNEIFRGLEFAPTAVPEPSTYALIGGGLGLLLLGQRARRRTTTTTLRA